MSNLTMIGSPSSDNDDRCPDWLMSFYGDNRLSDDLVSVFEDSLPLYDLDVSESGF